MFDAIIVGTGPSGTAAAMGLTGKKVLVLDVGLLPQGEKELKGNIFDLRRKDPNQQDYLIGKGFESLVNISSNDLVSVKLKAPYLSFVTQNTQKYFPIHTQNFSLFISYAMGGLANAWGAGAYPFNDYDLKNFPIDSNDLAPYYKELTDHVGISGKVDELADYLGDPRGIQKEIVPCETNRRLLDSYSKRRKKLTKKGVHIGYSRIAVLSEEKEGRPACDYGNLSFFTSKAPYIYTPTITIEELKKNPNFTFVNNHLVESYKEEAGIVNVQAKNLETGEPVQFKGKKLILAAGTVGSSRIVLASNRDYQTRLPILDNPVSFVPFLDFRSIGAKLETRDFEGAGLNLIYDGPLFPERVQGTIYGYISPLRADLFFNFPLALRANLALVKYITSALTIVQLFYPDKPQKENYLRLQDDNSLQINYNNELRRGKIERLLIRSFRSMGFLSAPFLVQYPPPGNSIHYAGTIPMGERKTPYSLNPNNRLNKTENVYIVDGSCFPELPAKNLTFTLMANALRVARRINDEM